MDLPFVTADIFCKIDFGFLFFLFFEKLPNGILIDIYGLSFLTIRNK